MDEGVQKVFNMHKLNVQFQGPLETNFQNWEEEFWKTVTLLMAKFPTLNKTDLHKLAPLLHSPTHPNHYAQIPKSNSKTFLENNFQTIFSPF